MLWGSLYETLPWVTPYRLKINAAFLRVVQVTAVGKSGCKVYGPDCRGERSAGKFVAGIGLSLGVPLRQREGSTPAWWPSPSCCVCSLGWQRAGKTKVWCEVRGSACRPVAGHAVKMFADTEKSDSWEAAASTAHDFSSPEGNLGDKKCQSSRGSAWVWRTTQRHKGKGNMMLPPIWSMLEAAISLHDSPAQSGNWQPPRTTALQEPRRGRGDPQLMELHRETSLHAGIRRPGTAWASCSSRDLLWGRAFTQLMAELSLPKQVKI